MKKAELLAKIRDYIAEAGETTNLKLAEEFDTDVSVIDSYLAELETEQEISIENPLVRFIKKAV